MPSPGSATGSRRISLILMAGQRGARLDRALSAILPGWSRSALQRLLREGRVRLPQGAVRASYRVRGGEQVEIDLPDPQPSTLEPEARPLAILHEDEDLIVLDKPAGMTVHPGAGARRGTLVNALLHHCRGLSLIGGRERPGIVHRLDRETSGVMVVAKNDAAHRSLAEQFKTRTVRKVYDALVWGRPKATEGVIDAPIGRHPTARVKMAIRPQGRPARSRYRVVASFGPVSLLELLPETGRTHQLRVHMSSIGHPVVGDRLYGGKSAPVVRDPNLREAIEAIHRLALHARSLGFRHPRTGDPCEFTAPRPAAFEEPLLILRARAAQPAGGGGGRP